MEDGDTVGEELRLLQIMGDQHDRDSNVAAKLRQLPAQAPAGQLIDGGERLVEEQYCRITGEGPSHRDALALPAGELGRAAFLEALHVDEGEQGPGAGTALRGRAMSHRHRNILHCAQVGKEREVLEYQPDLAVLDAHVNLSVRVEPGRAGAGDGATFGSIEPGDAAQHRGLAAAGWADECEQLRIAALELDVERNRGALVQRRRAIPETFRTGSASVNQLSDSRFQISDAGPTTRYRADQRNGDQRDQQKHRREGSRGLHVEGLNPVVDGDGEGAGLTGDVPAHHQHDPEFPEGMGEGEHEGGDDPRPRERQLDAQQGAHRGQAAHPRRLAHLVRNRGEGLLHRLNRKRQVEDQRRDDEARKAECEDPPGQRLEGGTRRRVGAEADQQIVAEHGGRKHEGQRDPPPRSRAFRGTGATRGHARRGDPAAA